MTEKEDLVGHRYRHIFLDAEGTLYVPKKGRSRWEFWATPSPEAALDFFELDVGVVETLKKLRGQVDSLCLVSRNTDTILSVLMDRFGISHSFDGVMLNGNKGKQIAEYLSRHGFRKENALMVGDMPSLDLYPVKREGVDAILVDREYNRWAKAERIKGIFELPSWLRIADLAEGMNRKRSRNTTLDEFLSGNRAGTKSLIAIPAT
ncbi:MAG: HAD family hydrolase [Thermoplasmata archaeon]